MVLALYCFELGKNSGSASLSRGVSSGKMDRVAINGRARYRTIVAEPRAVLHIGLCETQYLADRVRLWLQRASQGMSTAEREHDCPGRRVPLKPVSRPLGSPA